MLAIKLKPVGKKHQRSFRIIVIEKRCKLQGRFLEDLGWYNPRINQYSFNPERMVYYLQHGAQPTKTVSHILKSAKIQY